MKTIHQRIKVLHILLIMLVIGQNLNAQHNEVPIPGIHVYRGSAYGSIVSSNIGSSCDATGQNSFAGGYCSSAQGSCSFAFGNNATASQDNSLALGLNVTASQSTSFVIGSGYSSSLPLSGNNSGILMGTGSTKPTLFISRTTRNDNTGKVAIGDVTPLAKLHIRSDLDEDAGIIVAPADPTENISFIRLADSYHHLTVDANGEFEIAAGERSLLNFTAMNLLVGESTAMFGSSGRKLYFSSFDTPSISSNANPTSTGYNRETYGPSYTLEFGGNALLIKTAPYMQPRNDLITNWHTAVTIGTNNAITLNGKVGVNTQNTTGSYALAVAGGVITTKVHIQEVNEWEDRVFAEDYPLMPLGELETFVAAHHHLPSIPSEAEVKENGIDMAGMQAALLGKIEELTLYMIRQQKEIDSLRDLVTVHFAYDDCGNRISRTLQFQRQEGGKSGGLEDALKADEEQWYASLTDTYVGVEVNLFPNPTEGGFILSFTGGEIPDGVIVTLYTSDGKALESCMVTSATTEFDLVGKPAGIYLIRLVSERETMVLKVIKRN